MRWSAEPKVLSRFMLLTTTSFAVTTTSKGRAPEGSATEVVLNEPRSTFSTLSPATRKSSVPPPPFLEADR